jgi:hypothetical protein
LKDAETSGRPRLCTDSTKFYLHDITTDRCLRLGEDGFICGVGKSTVFTYDQFLSRSRLLTDKLMLQGFLQSRMMSAFRKFY